LVCIQFIQTSWITEQNVTEYKSYLQTTLLTGMTGAAKVRFV